MLNGKIAYDSDSVNFNLIEISTCCIPHRQNLKFRPAVSLTDKINAKRSNNGEHTKFKIVIFFY